VGVTFKSVQQTVSHVVCVTQMITLKLVAVMSQNIDVMTSHDRTCVQFVENGIHITAI